MRQDIIKYAMQRVSSLEETRLADLRKKYTKEGKDATPQELGAALKAGRLPFKKDVCLNGVDDYSKLRDIFDMDVLDKPGSFDKTAYRKESAPVVKAANKARDFIMLGNHQEALDSIREFEER